MILQYDEARARAGENGSDDMSVKALAAVVARVIQELAVTREALLMAVMRKEVID